MTPRAETGRGASRLVGGLATMLNGAASIWILVLMGLICADVTMRYLFSSPITGVTEIVEMSIVAIVFAQLPDVIRKDRIARADSLLGRLRGRVPLAARIIDIASAACGVALMALLAKGIFPEVLKDYQRGYFEGTPGLFTFPSWPGKAVVAFGVTISGLILLGCILSRLRGANDDL